MRVRICMEIQGLAQDEQGNPAPAGMCFTLGDPNSEDMPEDEYRAAMRNVTVEKVMNIVPFLNRFRPEDCRIIMPSEYDVKYGDGPND